MTKMIDTYKSILKYAGLHADSNGFISTLMDDRSEPALIRGARLVLPLQEHLRNPSPNEKIIFHPLSENILRDESEVINKLREVINVRLNFVFGIIGQSLLNLIASSEYHKQLSPDQAELLFAVKDVDETSLRNFINLMLEGVKRDSTKFFSSIYLKRGGSVRETRYSRIGVVSFDLYKELQKDSNEVYGVKLRVKDKETFKQLYKFIFPKVEDPASYNRGSDSDVAPFLDALMKTSMALASRFNDILTQYEGFIEDADKLVFDSEWVDVFDNLSVLNNEIRLVPMQAGNEGGVKIDAAQNTTVKPQLPVAQPAVQQQPQPAWQNQQQQYQPAWQAAQQPPTPQLVTTNRGVDWRSLQSVNPSLQHLPQPLAGHLQQQQMAMGMNSVRTPSWAAPAMGGMYNGGQMYQNTNYIQQNNIVPGYNI